MALPPTFLAETSTAERRSRALHRFIVASPILLLVAIGLVGHLRHRPYASPAGTSDYDRRVLAYRERVAAAEALPESDSPPIRPYAQEASRWIAGFDEGNLKPLTPAVYEDHFQTSVRGEAYRSGMKVASGLALAAERRQLDGHSDEAAPAALLAARLAKGLHGFELQACLQSLLLQRRAIGIVADAWPSLPATAREAAREGLATLRVDPQEIERMRALERDQTKDYRRRQSIGPADLPGTDLGDEAVAAIRRSVQVNDRRIDALIQGDAPIQGDAKRPASRQVP